MREQRSDHPFRRDRRLHSVLSLGVLLLAACVDEGPTAPAVAGVPAAARSEGVQAGAPVLGNRLAYLWAQTASPPLGTPYAPDKQRNYNGLGLANQVRRTATGAYLVTLGGMAKGATGKETFIVTAYAQTKVRCFIAGWGDSGANLNVGIGCVDFAGVPVDARFSLLMVGENSLAGRLAFAWANDPTSPQYTPDPSYSWNAPGNPITIIAPGQGTYLLDLDVPGPGAGQDTYLVSAYGIPDAMCTLTGWVPGSGRVGVACFDGTGTLSDRTFDVLKIEQGRPGMRLGYAVADQETRTTPYTPDPIHSFSTGGAITITRTQKGVYTVDFVGLQKPISTRTENVQVSPYQLSGSCSVPAWPKTPSGNGLRVWVVCRNPAGQVADMRFNVLVLE